MKPDDTPGDGGSWTHCAPDSEKKASFLSDIDRELGKSALASSDLALYKRELLTKMRRAEKGRLTFGTDSKAHDVCELGRSRGQLLEMRHDDVSTVDESGESVERHARLYFTERAAHPGELLTVAFYTKAPGPIGLDEQDGHIDISMKRLFSHEASGR